MGTTLLDEIVAWLSVNTGDYCCAYCSHPIEVVSDCLVELRPDIDELQIEALATHIVATYSERLHIQYFSLKSN